MLDIFGKEYVIDHVISEYNNRMEKRIYMCYTSDLLKNIAEYLGIEVNKRFYDLTNPKKEEQMSADEIAIDVIKRAGLRTK